MIKRLVYLLLGVLLTTQAPAQNYMGDYVVGDTVRCMWNSFDSSGASITRSTDGTVVAYENGGTTEITAGITDTEDFDGETGVHLVSIVATTANGFEPRSDYTVAVKDAVIDTQAVSAALCSFSIVNRNDQYLRVNTAQAGAATTITLDASASATNDFYGGSNFGMVIDIIAATGAGQTRVISGYVGSTKVATVNRAWGTNPDSTSIFAVRSGDIPIIAMTPGGLVDSNVGDFTSGAMDADAANADLTTEIMASLAFDSGTADSGTTTTAVDAAAFTSADADYYAKGFAILFTSGTLDKQSACIYDFDPATDKVTFRPALTQTVSTHTYILLSHPTCGGVVAP